MFIQDAQAASMNERIYWKFNLHRECSIVSMSGVRDYSILTAVVRWACHGVLQSTTKFLYLLMHSPAESSQTNYAISIATVMQIFYCLDYVNEAKLSLKNNCRVSHERFN